MMMNGNQKMSIVARFDDLCRYSTVLTEAAQDVDFIKFVGNQEDCRKRWLQVELENQRLHSIISKSEFEKNTLETRLKHTRNMICIEMEKRKRAEYEKDALERQLNLIKEILLDSNAVNDQTREKLAFLNNTCPRKFDSPRQLDIIDESAGSILSPSDVDVTEDDLDPPSFRTRSRLKTLGADGKKRPSAPPLSDDTPPKKTKLNEFLATADENDSIVAITTVTVPSKGPITAMSKIEAITAASGKMNRSHSEPPSKSHRSQSPVRLPFKSEGNHGDVDDDDDIKSLDWMETGLTPRVDYLRSASTISKKERRSSSVGIARRPHDFVSKTVIKPEKCITCDKRIKFGKMALKCKDCKTTCHATCKEQTPLPCTPNTPVNKGLKGCLIEEFAPKTAPLIPALILLCVMEVESRGLNELGIYRVPGSERDVKELKDKFLRGKGIPKLSKLDIHVVCGCIKDFLRAFKEPVVTYDLWKHFVSAILIRDERARFENIRSIVDKLPQTNRDTLAYMMLHLQLVAKSPECKMSTLNLARVFGPTLIGYSSPDPEPAEMLKETKLQTDVMEMLMTISQDYWVTFINVNADPPATPDSVGLNSDNIYGSQSSIDSVVCRSVRARNATTNYTPIGTLRSGLKTRPYKRQHFFSSPMLK